MADSPFEAVARRLGVLVGALDRRAQVLFFCCAACALLGDRAGDVDDALVAAQEFALSARVPDQMPQLLAALEKQQARLDEVELVLHDGLICADIALRLTSGGFNAQDGAWYVLEPQFQATSQRLFGFTDVGSDRQERDEAVALRDPALARAVDAAVLAVERLGTEPTERAAADMRAALHALRP